ncbi:ABC transporter ATP-binding protein [Bradyrhizobium guangdongense]|uniref:ABC transporter ATP-binding protein n=1 Tax=Bradyrhizobium guangdongense TaxID=1325090 RepID=A0A410V3L6_9BRAD|nr:ABC transporter ATP-binding protein [Bradyrhizobium guangdongense]QAU38226.1 ABC transporter ATP-binding protein [Bradyrhizobium guangdongense]QOZ59279.1 ABC transporter ATP-binding protein [Bradyrhizobium guangdongense]GGI33921.1 ABC transporter ATP-binding protein [Bradyrhizobium guangdongense]
MTELLRAEGLSAFYGPSRILFDVNLVLQEKRTLALLGRNGAGKSTTMKTLAGIVPARSGRIIFAGQDITRMPPHARARLGLAYVPEDRQVFPEHSVEDNLLIAAKSGPDGRRGWTLPRIWDTFPLLENLRAREAGRLSGGEQQLLVIARALMGNPLVLLLDEPSEGLAPMVVATISRMLRELGASGATILLAEQNMHFCLRIAEEAVVIDKGKVVHQQDTVGLARNEDIRRRYLAM